MVHVLRRLSVRDVEAMISTGVIAPEERVELLEGHLFTVNPQGMPTSSHASANGSALNIRSI